MTVRDWQFAALARDVDKLRSEIQRVEQIAKPARRVAEEATNTLQHVPQLDENGRIPPEKLGSGPTGTGARVLDDSGQWSPPGAAAHPDLATHTAMGLLGLPHDHTHNHDAAYSAVGHTHAGGSGVQWRQFTYLADSAGVTKTNIGSAFVEVGTASLRLRVDLTGFADVRLCLGVNKVGTGTQEWKAQYSADQSAWSDLTPLVSDAGAAGEKALAGAFGAIPAAALADVWLRVVGRSTVAADDPIVRSAHVQVR